MPTPPLTRMGQWMWAVAFILLLGLLTLFFNRHLARQQNPNAQITATTEGEVILQRNRAGHYVTTGRINGVEVEMMLDTGATDVSIPLAVAEQLQLAKGATRRYQTANGTLTAWLTELDSVEIGPLRVEAVRASINPAAEGDHAILLGMSFLRHLEFTQRGSQLILRPMGH